MANEITLHIDEHGEGRYELLVDGRPAGEIEFRTTEGRRVFTHTGIRDEFEGQGLAAHLARHVLDDVRAQGLQIVPLCPYVASYLAKHPDDADLVDTALWDRLRGR